MNGSPRLPHEPALDGLRGLAVAGVVAFHAGYAWARGGFLGVSTFFTLSGFLITSLLLAEQRSTGRIDLPAFWGRRARRLLPASLLTLFAVSVLAGALATPEQLDGLRGDVLGALGYVANWRFMLSGQSYGDLFSAPSLVLYFWSLAIEEQLYLIFPLLVFVVPRRRLPPVLCGLVLGSIALGWVLYTPGGSTSAAYYGTGVRAGELLVGALLALLVATPSAPRDGIATRTAGVVALAGLLLAWATVRQDATALYRGGFVTHAVVTAMVIAACLVPGPVRAVLSLAPLRALGRISYGVYLYHWPVFVWLTPERAQVDGHALVGVQVALTLTLAALSYRVVEQPIRQGRSVRSLGALLAVPLAMTLVAAAVIASTLHPPRPATFELAASEPPIPSEPIVEPTADAPRVAIFGDSTALRTGFGLRGWGWTTGQIDMRDGGAEVGCPLGRGGAVDFVVTRIESEPMCSEWPARWGMLVAREHLDAAVIEIGPWDVTDRKLEGSDTWTHIGEQSYDAFLEKEMNLAVDVLSADGALVVWLTSPQIEFGRELTGIPKDHPISDPARMRRLNELIAKVDAERDEMAVIDLAGHLRSLPGGEMDPTLRPDGTHFSEDASVDLADWLAPAIIDAVRGNR